MVDFLACPESASPVLNEGHKSDAAVPVQQVNVCRSPLVDKGALTYFSNFRRREVRYNSCKELGSGAFGTVYKCREIDDEAAETVAIKYIRITDAVDGIPQWALREIALLRRCSSRHPNIVSLVDMYCRHVDRRCDIHLVLEYCDMDLKEYIRSVSRNNGVPGLPPGQIKEVLYQMLRGLDFLHILAVAHRDIKPQNVLVKNGIVKIADFGLGKIMFEKAAVSLEVVTLHYRPPEVLLNVNYSLAVDIWSIGCIFGELCDNRVMLGGSCEMEQLKTIFRFLGLPQESDWPGSCAVTRDFFRALDDCSRGFLERYQKHIGDRGLDLLKRMLRFNPGHRVTSYDALKHNYFEGHISPVPYDTEPTVKTEKVVALLSHEMNNIKTQ
ncbi:hypothetical protein RvY_01431 [Ramazzottius varieornatus]|uniref:cyclin-dependent kinase n=1 Tax=Ramazzottius varieornatus TaxID=947166 RepID=A0A1D1UNE2_RAMVA|nr:hypothetical protein RvY_01431 [Ramazzottius varieornatus]